jgi:AraC family transcriptional regulator
VAEVFPPGYFTGETTSWRSASAILSEVRHTTTKPVPPHQHEAAYFSLLLEGSYAERGADFDIVYEPYTLVFHAAGSVHEDEMGTQSRFFAVELLPRWTDVIAELGGTRARVFELSGGEPVWLVLRLYRELHARGAEAESAVEDLVYQLCTHVAKRTLDEAEEPPWLRGVDAFVSERFYDSVDLRAIAEHAGVHPAHLCRVFRRFRGRTISDAVLGMRIQHVCRRLMEGDDALSAIAVETGFTDQSHMTRVFTRITGHSPGTHRRQERAALKPLDPR